jgi:Zn-dependent protease
MILGLLFEQPMIFVAWLVAIVFALTIHEFAHALAATMQGDPTAKLMGRLTFNPLAHIDVVGFLSLLLVGFGWGKPVPVNPIYFKNKKWGDTLVAFAGPLANFIAIIVFGIILRIVISTAVLDPTNLLISFLFFVIMINTVLGVFNLIPLPPLDGSHILFNILPSQFNELKYKLAKNGPWLLLTLIMADRFLGIGLLSGLFNFFQSFIYKIIFF